MHCIVAAALMDVHRNGQVDPTANRHFPDAARNCASGSRATLAHEAHAIQNADSRVLDRNVQSRKMVHAAASPSDA